ncbi:major facilitator superfamily domain-containing protein [Xylaria digitata]|nr:major facilitator superfamily domain-containing protein [Xylaria digitata]
MGGYFSALRARTRRVAFEIKYDPEDPDAAIQSVIDRRGLDGFQWRVWWVAASGFFTTSYSIFAVNVISPMLTYVYPDPNCSTGWSGSSLIINLATLIGTIIGAIVFGFLADRHGRKSVYGLELAIVIMATIGITTASTGYDHSMQVYGWILFWRALLGIGLGAEYPLSSIIAAEWSSTKSRGRMMAAVFLMQSVGQLAAYGFGLAILVGISKRLGLSPDEKDRAIAAPKIDVIWRAIIGVGAFPALVSLVLRRTIPETPYYLVETGRVTDAVTAAREVYAPEYTLQPTGHDALSPIETVSDGPAEKAGKHKGSWWANTTEYIREIKEHLSQKSRWRILLGVMFTWWLLDLAYYGLGLDNPKTISEIWLWQAPDPSNNASLGCDGAQDIEIYTMLYGNIVRNIATISSGALPGSIIILLAIDYVPRVTWMAWTFVVLAALFAVNGGTLFIAFETDKHGLTIILYVLAQVIFNLGPNTMTFILPAELFATKFRGTFYGLAAASGKLGAITILLIINLGVYGGKTSLPSGVPFAKTLLGFVPAMLLGAFITWVWIPEVQFPRGHATEIVRGENTSDDGTNEDLQESTFVKKLKLPNRPLAHIAQNPEGGQVLGVRRNLIRLIQRVRGSHRRDSTSYTLESGVDDVSRTVDSSGAHYLMHSQPFNGHEVDPDSGDLGTRIPSHG